MIGLLRKLLPASATSVGICAGCNHHVERDSHKTFIAGFWWHKGCATGGYVPRRAS